MGGAVPAGSSGGRDRWRDQLLSKANVRPIFFCALAVIGAILYGYDGTYFTGILEMDRFKRDFGVINPENGLYEIPPTISLSTPLSSKLARWSDLSWQHHSVTTSADEVVSSVPAPWSPSVSCSSS